MLFIVLLFSLMTVEQSSRRIYRITFLFAGLPAATVTLFLSTQYAKAYHLKPPDKNKKEPGLLRAP
jgi:hypothetical protein